jgi:hypothetical protein
MQKRAFNAPRWLISNIETGVNQPSRAATDGHEATG